VEATLMPTSTLALWKETTMRLRKVMQALASLAALAMAIEAAWKPLR
jgi:hypothetical protein